ncbi:MAG: UxaA family hydrolase, partial [Planctomycetaceae bacterium]
MARLGRVELFLGPRHMNQPSVILLRPEDDVAVATRRLEPGEDIEFHADRIPVRDVVAMGHKIALRPIAKGAPVRKYGQVIGFATKAISAGSLVHVSNLEAGNFDRDYAFSSEVKPVEFTKEKRTFQGYDRGDGRYGTRNYIALVSTVNCSASTSRYIVRRLEQLGVLKDYPGVDGVVAVTHKAGCAMQYGGPDHLQLDRTLAGFARHANVAAYLIIGLGCETGQAAHLIE